MAGLTSSPAERAAATPSVGAFAQAARGAIARDDGAVTERLEAASRGVLDGVPGGAQPLRDLGPESGLEVHRAIVPAAPRQTAEPARPVYRGLDVQSKVELVHEDLKVRLRLTSAARGRARD